MLWREASSIGTSARPVSSAPPNIECAAVAGEELVKQLIDYLLIVQKQREELLRHRFKDIFIKIQEKINKIDRDLRSADHSYDEQQKRCRAACTPLFKAREKLREYCSVLPVFGFNMSGFDGPLLLREGLVRTAENKCGLSASVLFKKTNKLLKIDFSKKTDQGACCVLRILDAHLCPSRICLN